MTGGLWLGVYAHVATLLLPVVCCAGVGAVWGVRKLTYPAEFIAMLATVVSTPALVFHTLMTTRLDNVQLLEVGSATLLGLALAAVFSGIALRSLNMPARTLGPRLRFPIPATSGFPSRNWRSATPGWRSRSRSLLSTLSFSTRRASGC